MIINRPTQEQMELRVRELSDHELDSAAGGSLLESSLKLMGEILSNVSKTRSEISMTFARNARA